MNTNASVTEPVRVALTPRSTVAEAFDAWHKFLDPGRKPMSRAHIRGFMGTFVKFFPAERTIGSITRNDVADWVNALIARGYMGNTIRDRLKRIGAVFRWLAEDSIVSINPVQKSRLPKLSREGRRRLPFSYEHLQKVLAHLAARTSPSHDFWATACLVSYHTGLRCSDVCCLRWEPDAEGRGNVVDFEKEIIIAWPMKLSKSLQRLEIPVDPELFDCLKKQREEWDPFYGPWVLPVMHLLYFSNRRVITQGFRDICTRSGFPEHSFHSFRHGFVSRLVNAGVDPIIISSMTGQSREQILRYSHVTTEAKVVALEIARAALHRVNIEQLRPKTETVIKL